MTSVRTFKPNLLASIVILFPAAGLASIALIPWIQGDTPIHAAKTSLLWLGFALAYVLAFSPIHSYRLILEDVKIISRNWYGKREVVYGDMEKLEVYMHGPYGALVLRIKGKENKVLLVVFLNRFEEEDSPIIVSQIASRAPQAELNERAVLCIKEKSETSIAT